MLVRGIAIAILRLAYKEDGQQTVREPVLVCITGKLSGWNVRIKGSMSICWGDRARIIVWLALTRRVACRWSTLSMMKH
jgi:hypothetical protein